MPQLEHIEAIEKRLWSAADTLLSYFGRARNERFFVRFAGLRKGGPVRRMESLPYDNARAAQSHRTR